MPVAGVERKAGDYCDGMIFGNEIEMLIKILVFLLFAICAIQDIRIKKISKLPIFLGGGIIATIVLVTNFYLAGEYLGEQLLGLLSGLIILGLSVCLPGKIGKGDGILLCISGLGLGLAQNLAILVYGLLSAGLVSVVLLVLHKIKRGGSIPFVPFLLFGYIVCFLCQGSI